jgi:hypothetical protein
MIPSEADEFEEWMQDFQRNREPSPERPKRAPRSPSAAPRKKAASQPRASKQTGGGDEEIVVGRNIVRDSEYVQGVIDVAERRKVLDPENYYPHLKLFELERLVRKYNKAKELDALVDQYFLYDDSTKNIYSTLINDLTNEYVSVESFIEKLVRCYPSVKMIVEDFGTRGMGLSFSNKESAVGYFLYGLSKEEVVELVQPILREKWSDGLREKAIHDTLVTNIERFRKLRNAFLVDNNPAILKKMRDIVREVGYRDISVDYDMKFISDLAKIAAGKREPNVADSRFSIKTAINGNVTNAKATKISNFFKKYIDAYRKDPASMGYIPSWVKFMVDIHEGKNGYTIDAKTGLPKETSEKYVDNSTVDPKKSLFKEIMNVDVDQKLLEIYYNLRSDITYADKTSAELQQLSVETYKQLSGSSGIVVSNVVTEVRETREQREERRQLAHDAAQRVITEDVDEDDPAIDALEKKKRLEKAKRQLEKDFDDEDLELDEGEVGTIIQQTMAQ